MSQISGSAASATSMKGERKPSEPIMPRDAPSGRLGRMQVRGRAGKPRLQEEKSFGRRSVGVMDGKREACLPRR